MNKTIKLLLNLMTLLAVALLAGCGGGGGGDSGVSNTASGNTSGTGTGTGTGVGTDTGTETAPITAPAITAQPASITVTELQPASFSITATSAAPLTYQWKRNGTPVAGATSSTLTISSALPADHSARYSAVVSNSAGSVTSLEAVLTQELPMFLLGGQSNMQGNVDTTLFQQLLAELASSANDQTKKTNLAERIKAWTNVPGRDYGYSATMATFEAAELVRLNAAGLVGTNLTTPNPKVFCSFNELPLTPLNAAPAAALKTRCGDPIGPEVVFGQALSKAGYSSTSLIKVAYGGTNLYADWRSPLMGGTPSAKDLYAKLRTRIQSLKSDPASVNPNCKTRTCQWSAFVWFQGEADAETAFAPLYEENLKNFIASVRADVGSPTLPVVIVQIGSWAQSLNRGKGIDVATAQTAVVKADKYARIVNTADLNGYYHYDPAAQLIIGERVALAVQSLLAAAPAAK